MRYTTRIIVPPRIRRSGPPGSPGGAYGPQVLGVRRTLGLGDRLGVATSGHIAVAAAHPEFAPVFAQQSVQEMSATGRAAADVVSSAARAVSAARFRLPWGANADRLCTAQEVADAAEAGFTMFTFDLAEFVRPGVQAMEPAALQSAVNEMVAGGDLPDHWAEPYLDRTIDLPGGHQLRVTLEPLQRAVVRYLPAILHGARLSSALARSNQGRPFEVEVALDTVSAPVSTLEHLFIGLELEARGVRMTSLALPYADRAAAGRGGAVTETFEQQLREHAAVAEFCGPYKLSFDEALHPASIYPVLGRVCGEALHLKTSAASYVEALRVLAQVEPGLFREIAGFATAEVQAREAQETSSHRSIDLTFIEPLLAGDEPGQVLDEEMGLRLLDATFGAVLTVGRDAAGRPFKESILETLDRYGDLYTERLLVRFGQRLALFDAA